MRDLLVELRELADVVIIDGAVLDSGTLALAAAVDHVVWVLDSRHATSRGARRIARRCIEAGSAPLGLVINRAGSAA
jgi:Mrp family chromosome partitioning ATPase